MEKIIAFSLVVLMTILITVGVVLAVDPHTRFTHQNEVCVYYDGLVQCQVPNTNCYGDGTNKYGDLGACSEVGTPLDGGEWEPRAAPTASGECPIVVNEGEKVEIVWVGTDPDEDIGPQEYLSYEYSGVVGEDGVWQTEKGDAGIHQASAKVYDGEFWDETELCIEVLKTNSAAILTLDSQDVSVYEGEEVVLATSCSDPDGDDVTITYTGWMTGPTKQTDYNDAGNYQVTVKCIDPEGEGQTKQVDVEVLNKNRPPNIIWRQKGQE